MTPALLMDYVEVVVKFALAMVCVYAGVVFVRRHF
jgi:hypothetical protein